jgi:hypothetical protein
MAATMANKRARLDLAPGCKLCADENDFPQFAGHMSGMCSFCYADVGRIFAWRGWPYKQHEAMGARRALVLKRYRLKEEQQAERARLREQYVQGESYAVLAKTPADMAAVMAAVLAKPPATSEELGAILDSGSSPLLTVPQAAAIMDALYPDVELKNMGIPALRDAHVLQRRCLGHDVKRDYGKLPEADKYYNATVTNVQNDLRIRASLQRNRRYDDNSGTKTYALRQIAVLGAVDVVSMR